MAERGLLTETERRVLAGEHGDEAYLTTVRTRLRRRLDALETDVAVLETHEPELHERLRSIVFGHRH